MSQPTTSGIFTTAQSLVGDSSGQIATTAALTPFWTGVVYPELFEAMAKIQVPQVQREFYYTLPAFQTYLDPAAIGIADMGNPTLMDERAAGTLLPAIVSTSNTTPIVVLFASAPPISTNNEIEINGVAGTVAPWGRWFVTQGVDSSHWILNGSVTDGTAGTGGTGYLSSGQGFSPVSAATVWEPGNYQIGSALGVYFWQAGAFKFVGATAPRQIHVTYWASGYPPSNLATPLMDDCGTYASTRLAGLFAGGKGWYQMSDKYEVAALGPNRVADGRGGLLRGFVLTQIRSLQRGDIRRLPFRPRGPINPSIGVSGLTGGFTNGGGGTPIPGNVDVFEYTLTADTAVTVPVGITVDNTFWLTFLQDSTGGHLVILSGTAWSSSIDPSLWSGSLVAGNTRVSVPFVLLSTGMIVLNGVIAGPTAI